MLRFATSGGKTVIYFKLLFILEANEPRKSQQEPAQTTRLRLEADKCANRKKWPADAMMLSENGETMLTALQKEAIKEAGVEVAILRLAAISRLEPQSAVHGYRCPPPKKQDVEVWLNTELKLRRAKANYRGLIATISVMTLVGGVWALLWAATF